MIKIVLFILLLAYGTTSETADSTTAPREANSVFIPGMGLHTGKTGTEKEEVVSTLSEWGPPDHNWDSESAGGDGKGTPGKGDSSPVRGKKKEDPVPKDPGWIGDCYYYTDGSYYHKKGEFRLPDDTTRYVYQEKLWYFPNGGILEPATGFYRPYVPEIGGIVGRVLRIAAAISVFTAGTPDCPDVPPEPLPKEDRGD